MTIDRLSLLLGFVLGVFVWWCIASLVVWRIKRRLATELVLTILADGRKISGRDLAARVNIGRVAFYSLMADLEDEGLVNCEQWLDQRLYWHAMVAHDARKIGGGIGASRLSSCD